MQNFNYGVIGNCKTAALVSEKGSIEWLCLPDFNSPSVFAKILDHGKGGEFGFDINPEYVISQRYLEDTNILSTDFSRGQDKFQVIDFMPRYRNEDGSYYCPPDIIRYVRLISGTPEFRVRYQPRLLYAEYDTFTKSTPHYLKSFASDSNYESMYLYSNLGLDAVYSGQTVTLRENAFFLISYNEKIIEPTVRRIHLEYVKTRAYWMTWSSQLRKFPLYRKEIIRSALVLKLLTYETSGAVLAAVTTSLPEIIGGVRNWDYRYCWIRDASMIIKTFISLGEDRDAKRFLSYFLRIVPWKGDKIQIMYGINGEKRLKEYILPHLEGYMGSKPVRVGNHAYLQKQNDIYGVLMEVIHQSLMFTRHPDWAEDLWTMARSLIRTVKKNWMKSDVGIWEFRSQKRHYTFSKVLCWVAMDRGIKIAEHLEQHHYLEEWTGIRDKIKSDILEKGWNSNAGAFTQSYENSEMDAANLLMEEYGFISADDPRYVSTVKLTYQELCRDGLMYRYKNKDDFGKPTTSFVICTFWMIKSLYKIGEIAQAEAMFDHLLKHANHLGLFSEGVDFESKRLLGNFPQGYSHLALIDTAMLLSGGPIKGPLGLFHSA